MSESRPERVAVIAVHGVADQKPQETARAAADLLLRSNGGTRYREFSGCEVRLRVEPVLRRSPEREAAPEPVAPGALSVRQEAWTVRDRLAEEEGEDRSPIEHDYMEEQLAGYVPGGGDEIYETVSLHGRREGVPGEPGCEVHVYEMFWADLSRLGDRLIGVFFDLYQLLFFLCTLGRNTLGIARAEVARVEGTRSRWWQAFALAQGAAERALVLGVPILNLALLGMASVLLVALLPEGAQEPGFVAAVAVVAAVLTGCLLYRWRERWEARHWPALFLVALVVAAAAGAGAWRAGFSHKAAALTLWLVAAALLAVLMLAYQRRQPGAFPVALAVLALMSTFYGWHLFGTANTWEGVFEAAQAAALLTKNYILNPVWGLFVLAALLATVTGFVAVRWGCATEGCRKLARRAAWTANLTLVLPGALVLIVNIALWQALLGLGRRFLEEEEATALLVPVQELVNDSVLPGFLYGFALFGLGVLLTAWSIVPAVLSETSRPGGTARAVAWLGESLSRGFGAMRVSGETVRWLVVVGLLAAIVVRATLGHEPDALTQRVILVVGTLLVVALVGSRGPMRFLALGFRAAMDVALDVANWLRITPRDRTPTARICARYTALLRHLLAWRDPVDGHGYSALVIFAHSQGTVITAELLRFLQHEIATRGTGRLHEDLSGLRPGEARPRVYLFTMGCPLRQLFSLRFPHQYGWARHDDTSWPGQRPDPAELGVELWSNAYRSGDYVGRYLWHPDRGSDPWAVPPPGGPVREAAGRREFCIGAGGHIHYWDESAPEIADELDRLIVRACRVAHSPP